MAEPFESECITLREHLEMRIENLIDRIENNDRLYQERYITGEGAKILAKEIVDGQLSGLKDVQLTLSKIQDETFTKSEHTAYMKAVDADLRTANANVAALREARAEGSGRSGLNYIIITVGIAVLGVLLNGCGIVAVLTTLIAHIFKIF